MSNAEGENLDEKTFEDEVVESLLKAVRLAEKGRKVDKSGVTIVADTLEITSLPQLPTEVKEEIKPFSEMLNEKIVKVVNSIEETINNFQDSFKEAIRIQINEFSKALKELGYIVAKSFTEKLNIKILERKLRKMYEEISEKVIMEKGKEFLQNTLQAIVPLYTQITERLQQLQKDINEIRELYLNWIQGFSSLVAEELHSSRDEIGELIDIKKQLEAEIHGLREKLKQVEKERDELAHKISTGQIASEDLEKYALQLKRKDTEINALKEQLNELNGKYKAALEKIETMRKALNEKELKIQELEARLSTVREGIKTSEELLKVREYYEQQLLEKDKEIHALRAQIEELKNLQNALQSFVNELKSIAPTPIEPEKLVSPEELAKKYQEFLNSLRTEIVRLRDEYHQKLKQLSDIVSRNKVLEERVAILEQEIENYKKREEELLQELSKLKSEKAYLENQLKDLQAQVAGSMPQLSELRKILDLTLVGKAYLIIREVKEIDLNRLAAALGTDKFHVQRELFKLVRMGIIKIEGNKVKYLGTT